MKIIIDGDGCPTKDIVYKLGYRYSIEVVLVQSICHYSSNIPDNVRLITVDNQPESADIQISNITKQGDIVITGDYGLASIVLGKGARVISFNGDIYTEGNIDEYLFLRYICKKSLQQRKRVKGPKPRTNEEDQRFYNTLLSLIT